MTYKIFQWAEESRRRRKSSRQAVKQIMAPPGCDRKSHQNRTLNLRINGSNWIFKESLRNPRFSGIPWISNPNELENLCKIFLRSVLPLGRHRAGYSPRRLRILRWSRESRIDEPHTSQFKLPLWVNERHVAPSVEPVSFQPPLGDA